MLAKLEISIVNGTQFASLVCDIIHDYGCYCCCCRMAEHALFNFLNIFHSQLVSAIFYFCLHHCHQYISINHIKVDKIKFYAALHMIHMTIPFKRDQRRCKQFIQRWNRFEWIDKSRIEVSPFFSFFPVFPWANILLLISQMMGYVSWNLLFAKLLHIFHPFSLFKAFEISMPIWEHLRL